MRRLGAGRRGAWAAVFLAGLVSGLALATALAGGAPGARSQGAFPEGAFVQGQDETRWVVGGGRRFRLAFVSDDAGLLPSLGEGDPVATVCEAAAAVGGADAAACGPRVAVAPPVADAPPPATAAGVLLEARGGHSNNRQISTESFTLTAPAQVEICWEMSGPVPEVGINPWLDISVWDRQTDRPEIGGPVQRRAPGCWPEGDAGPVNRLPAGTYYLKVTSYFREWRVVVRAR